VPRLTDQEATEAISFVRLLSPGFELYTRHCAACHGDDGHGVGSFGEVVYLISGDRGSPEYATAARWWNREESEKSAFKSGSTPQYRGLLSQAIRQELPDARVAGGVVEFGTADEYSIFRGDCLDRWVRFEGRNDPNVAHFRDAYKDIMNPPDLSWRRMVLSEGPAIMDKLIAGVAAW